MAHKFDVEMKAGTLWNKIQRTDGLLGIFFVKTSEGFAFRTASVNKRELFQKAKQAQNATLVGLYDKRAKVEWVLEDMEYMLEGGK
jgi:hypothetical protein